MWFKNLTLFRLNQHFPLDHDALAQALETERFQPCSKIAPFSLGWVTPLAAAGGDPAGPLCHTLGPFSLLALRKEERILPAAVVREKLEEQVATIEATEGRPVGRKEQQRLKEELVQTLLPQSFTRSRRTYAYLDRKGGWLVVDSSSANRAEELLGQLRQSVEGAVEGFGARPAATLESPRVVMSGWLQGEATPKGFALGEELDLQAGDREQGVVRCRHLDPFSEEIQAHLAAGKVVTKLALDWRERLEFVLDDKLAIKRLKATDTLLESLDHGYEDPLQQFDSDFAAMTLELAQFIDELLALFGGEAPQQAV